MIHTLSTELSTILVFSCGLVVIFALFMYVWMVRLAQYCRSAIEFVQNQNAKSLSLRRLAELDAAVTELTDSYQAILASNKKLRARIGMRAVRKRRNDAEIELDSTAPSDEAERARYKAALRNKLKANGRL